MEALRVATVLDIKIGFQTFRPDGQEVSIPRATTTSLTLTLTPTRTLTPTLTAPRAQSSQAPLLESADDWKVQYGVSVEGVSVKERPFPSEIAVVSGPGSRPDGVIWSMQTKTVI